MVNPPRRPQVTEWHYQGQGITLEKGAEMGRFLLGSTVVMLWPQATLGFNPEWAPTRAIRLGEKMADSLS